MNDDKTRLSAEAALNKYLSSKGLRRTPERYAILDKVLEMHKHFSIEVLCRAMEGEPFSVSRATVYNTIDIFEQAGIVRRHRFDNRPAQFEKTVDAAANHQHLICSKCGKVKEINNQALTRALSETRFPSFSVEYFQFYAYGICSACTRRIKREAKAASQQEQRTRSQNSD